MTRLIAELVHVGAPSSGRDTSVITEWQKNLADVCSSSNPKSTSLMKRSLILAHANLSMLRASYLTVGLRAVGSVGPRLEEGSELVSGLAYNLWRNRIFRV